MDQVIKRILLKVLVIASGLFFATAYAQLSTQTPVGYWKTVDDATGQPKSIVQIYEGENKVLAGRVVKVFPASGKDSAHVCVACKGDKMNQPIVGMVILSGLKAKEAQWGNGEILDPENGKTYSCSLKVADHGNKLNVHGYIGLPLLGRSQTWERVDIMSENG